MFPRESDILMKQAQYADLLKEAETERFIRAAQLQQPDLWHATRKVIHWLGNQLVKWAQSCKIILERLRQRSFLKRRKPKVMTHLAPR